MLISEFSPQVLLLKTQERRDRRLPSAEHVQPPLSGFDGSCPRFRVTCSTQAGRAPRASDGHGRRYRWSPSWAKNTDGNHVNMNRLAYVMSFVAINTGISC